MCLCHSKESSEGDCHPAASVDLLSGCAVPMLSKLFFLISVAFCRRTHRIEISKIKTKVITPQDPSPHPHCQTRAIIKAILLVHGNSTIHVHRCTCTYIIHRHQPTTDSNISHVARNMYGGGNIFKPHGDRGRICTFL